MANSLAIRVAAAAAAAALLVSIPASATAQYFGRNKVQYDEFQFRVLQTEHLDIYFYPEEEEAVRDAARMGERWYERLSLVFRHEIEQRQPVVLYANHPDFQQTNVIGGLIGESTGGVTEGLRNRVVLPITDSYESTNHVLGHELVHAFQYDIAKSPGGPGLRGLNQVPLWIVEGMAEYLSNGRVDSHTAMWLRDAALRNELPSIQELSNPRFFPYRYGQAALAFIGGRYGDRAVVDIFRATAQVGVEGAIRTVLGIDSEALSRQWHQAIRDLYLPAVAGRERPAEVGRRVIGPEGEGGETNLAPAISPDGRRLGFLSELGLFSIDLYMADAETGEVLREMADAPTSPHFDALSFMSTAGTWSPDGRRFAFVVFAEGDNEIGILDVETGRVVRQVGVPGIGAISGPSWSPDGRYIAFSGSAGGISDLYLLDLRTDTVVQLTDDRYSAIQPEWSPDGGTLAFATDRAPTTSFESMVFTHTRLALLDLETRQVRPLPIFDSAKHINPQYSPDGRDLYFIADPDGFSNIFRISLETGEIFQVTDVATGISGITALAPAMTVAEQTGRIAFSVYADGNYYIHTLEPDAARGVPVEPAAGEQIPMAAVLPPVEALGQGIISDYLGAPRAGLPPEDTEFAVERYSPSLGLTYIGSPRIGVSAGTYGTGFAGGTSLYFSDLLGDRVLGAALQMNGQLKDIGGQVVYQNRSDRWNWGAGAGHTSYLVGMAARYDTVVVDVGGGQQTPVLSLDIYRSRIFYDQASLMTEYPLSRTRRFEFSGGYTYVWYDVEIERNFRVGNRTERRVVSPDSLEPPGLSLFQGSAAFVGDYSFSGLTAPIEGGRYRFELQPTLGSLQFVGAIADYRRYLFWRPFTLAFRGFHYGRYGRDSEDDRLGPIFLGREVYIRGYSADSFDFTGCGTISPTDGTCDAIRQVGRLIGSRIAVANVELRLPLLGPERLGVINFPYVPTDVAAFFDAGVAWCGAEPLNPGSICPAGDETPIFNLSALTDERTPVFSAGVTARFNLLGYAVLEVYYAYPFQRPDEGAHFGFQLAPGW